MSRSKLILGVLLIALFISGCGATKAEFSAFAQAGTGYAVAVDNLLTAAGTTQVNSSSWILLLEKESTSVDAALYKKKNQDDSSQLELIARLKRQAKLLGRYFGYLEALATSDAPDRTQSSIEGVVTKLAEIKSDLPEITSALPDIGKVIVDLKIRSALRNELKKREKFIRQNLEIQEVLLKDLSQQITSTLERSKMAEDQIIVRGPILSKTGVKAPEKWVSDRRRVLFTELTVDELESASQAATKLREAFEGVLSGEVTFGRINALITDVEGLIAIAEIINTEGSN